MDFVKFAQENWAVIEQAPWAFVTFGAFCGLAGFWIATKVGAERLAFAQEAAKEWKDRLAAKTPEEVARQIADLKQQIAELATVELTRNQVLTLQQELGKGDPSGVKLATDIAGIGNSRMHDQIIAIFNQARWAVHRALLVSSDHSSPSGIGLLVGTAQGSLIEPSARIKAAFDAANIEYTIHKHPEDATDQMPQINFTRPGRV